MRGRAVHGFALAATSAVILGGCAGASLPYAFDRVKARAAPKHALRVALLPLRDARPESESRDTSKTFRYRGTDFIATRLSDLPGSIEYKVTDVLGRHLAGSRVFAQVVLVLGLEQAESADLVLEGEVFRMRGYVEAKAPTKKSKRPPNERRTLSEVLIKNLRLRDAKDPSRIVADMDAGWATERTVSLTDEMPNVDPWDVLAHTLFVAVDRYISQLERADLSDDFRLREEVGLVSGTSTATSFTELGGRTPDGWTFSKTSSASSPRGWRGPATCEAQAFVAKNVARFDRSIGPYAPTVRVWRCPRRGPWRFDGREDFPSLYLGTGAQGAHHFLRAVGRTNWPGAQREISKALKLTTPKERYKFEVGAPAGATL